MTSHTPEHTHTDDHSSGHADYGSHGHGSHADVHAGSHESGAIHNYIQAKKQATIGATRYNRMLNEAYWHAVRDELGDDFSVLSDAKKARNFGYNLAKTAVLRAGLTAMGLSDEAKHDIEDKQAERAFRMLTGGRMGMNDYAEQVVEHGEDFSQESIRLHLSLVNIYTQHDTEALAYKHLKDVSGDDIYKAIGSPDLREGITIGKLDFLRPEAKAALVDRYKKEGHISPNDLERIVERALH